ncbi:MAG: hypothetical protein AAGJ73_13320 [Pseudomonadota bacterium]
MTNTTFEQIEFIAETATPLFDIDAIFDRMTSDADYPFDTDEEIAIGEREKQTEQAWLERREGAEIDADDNDDPDGSGGGAGTPFGPPTVDEYMDHLDREWREELVRLSTWVAGNPDYTEIASSSLLHCIDQERRAIIEWRDNR